MMNEKPNKSTIQFQNMILNNICLVTLIILLV